METQPTAARRTGYSVERTICITLMRDPRVRGIIAGTYYGVMHQVGIATTYAESLKFAQDLYSDTAVPDMCDGVGITMIGGA